MGRGGHRRVLARREGARGHGWGAGRGRAARSCAIAIAIANGVDCGGAGIGPAVSHPPCERAKLHLFQKGHQGRAVRVVDHQLFEGHRHGRIDIQPYQLARQADLVGKVDQGLAALVLLDLARAGQNRVQITIFIDQQRRRLDANSRRTGHIIDAVAGQGLKIDHLVRADPELVEHLFGPDLEVLHGVEHHHPIPDQLHQVLIRRDNHRLAAHVTHVGGIGGDQVIGLIVGQLNGWNAKGPGRLAHQRKLRDQVLRRGRAMGLVGGIEIIAEGLARLVKDHRQMGRPIGRGPHLDQELPEHIAKALHRPHRHAVRLARQRRQGVIGPENITRPIHQIEPHRRMVWGGRGEQGVSGFGHRPRIGRSCGLVTRGDLMPSQRPSRWGGCGDGR